jgi:hypothetical protein
MTIVRKLINYKLSNEIKMYICYFLSLAIFTIPNFIGPVNNFIKNNTEYRLYLVAFIWATACLQIGVKIYRKWRK